MIASTWLYVNRLRRERELDLLRVEPFLDLQVQLLQRGEIADGYAIDDGAALHFVESEVRGVVASRPKATAYRVQMQDGMVREVALPVDYRAAS